MRRLIYILLSLFLIACHHPHPGAPALPEYGSAGSGKIQVTISGDVKQPGKHWVQEGATLASIEQIFGSSGGRGDFGGVGPLRVILLRQREGKAEHSVYSLRQNRERLQAVTLYHGDELRYAVVVF